MHIRSSFAHVAVRFDETYRRCCTNPTHVAEYNSSATINAPVHVYYQWTLREPLGDVIEVPKTRTCQCSVLTGHMNNRVVLNPYRQSSLHRPAQVHLISPCRSRHRIVSCHRLYYIGGATSRSRCSQQMKGRSAGLIQAPAKEPMVRIGPATANSRHGIMLGRNPDMVTFRILQVEFASMWWRFFSCRKSVLCSIVSATVCWEGVVINLWAA